MPTKREREYYQMGFTDGLRVGRGGDIQFGIAEERMEEREVLLRDRYGQVVQSRRKPKRKLSAWQKYIKNKRNHITYRDGKLNLKAMGVQYRKKKRR